MTALLLKGIFKMNKSALITFLLFLVTSWAMAQLVTVTGSVKDSNTKNPLPGVSILVKGKQLGTTSDFDGNFKIEVEKGNVLIFSYLGFSDLERTVDSSTLHVVLEENQQKLDEVVIIGYGTTTIKDATGSLVSVISKDFNKGNIVTPENLLNGRVAGLTINTGGEPGAGSTIRIRGGSSLDASNSPLIVINGLPIDNDNVGGSRSILSSINPNDIASFSVLKDASATAIYGSRASNGVIIITTKKGTKNFRVNLDLQMGINTLPNKVSVFSGDEYRLLVAKENPELLPLLGQANTDWQDEIYRTGVSSSQNLSLQGALFDVLPTRLSLGRTTQQGLRLTSEFERNTGGLTLNPSLFDDHLKISLNANGTIEKNRFANGEEGNAIGFDPTQPVYDTNSPFDGFFQYTNINNDDGLNELNLADLIPNSPFNPVANLLQRNSTSTVQRLYGNLKLEYKVHFFPNLTLTANVGYDEQSADGEVRIRSASPSVAQPDGRLIGSESNYSNYQVNRLFDGYANYSINKGKLGVALTTGYSYQQFKSNRFISGELLNDQPDTAPVYNMDTDLILVGFFARTNLSFADKYLLTLSYRRDGTSRFSKKNRWGNFPSAAFAWKLKETLFPSYETISTLKLRLGLGITGQQDIGRSNGDLFLERYVRGLPASQFQFGDTVIPIGIPQFRNENLKWEETTTYNAGFDFGILNDRFTGSIEGFYKESEDLLANSAISDGANFSNSGFQNVGVFSSKGIEFSIGGDLVRSDNFTWSLNANATYLETEIDALALDQDQLVGGIAGGTGGNIQLRRVGFNPFSFFVYKQIYDASGAPIEGGFADLNGDNIINSEDRYIYKNGAPDVTTGLLSNMSYKKVDLSFSLRANVGNYVYNNVNSTRAQLSLLENNSVAANLPKSVLNSGFNVTEDVILSDYFIENASFLRMDNLAIGYTFEKIINTSSNLRLSAAVQNVFVITNYSGLDPEVFGNGIDNTIFPRSRTFLLGANFKF